ncbi:DUF4381 domain-containing protein [Halomonas sp. V046]|uniref:DUF4381 domain-containing protein n=1 Tax=Halomonas sp. V046 TaxID=3459611 RepID=UPI004043FBFE
MSSDAAAALAQTPTADDASLPPATLAQLLDQMSPAPTPADIAWLPQTWGWALLGLALLLLAMWLGLRARRRYRARAYRRQALAEVNACLRNGAGVTALAEILRRTALVAYPRHRVASLHGDAWRHFLDSEVPMPRQKGFTGPLGELLVGSPYHSGSPEATAVTDLAVLVKDWIQRHPGPTSSRGANA